MGRDGDSWYGRTSASFDSGFCTTATYCSRVDYGRRERIDEILMEKSTMADKSHEIVDGVPTYKLFINGEWITSSRNALDDSINPANGEVFARVQQAGPDVIEYY